MTTTPTTLLLLLATLAIAAAQTTTVTAPTAYVALAWDPNPEPDLAGYRVYKDGDPAERIAEVARPIADDPIPTTIKLSLSAGDYVVYVTAYNAAGLESAPSESVAFTVPTAPKGLRVVITLHLERDGEPLEYSRVRESAPARRGAMYYVARVEE